MEVLGRWRFLVSEVSLYQWRAAWERTVFPHACSAPPHGGARIFHQKSTCLTAIDFKVKSGHVTPRFRNPWHALVPVAGGVGEDGLLRATCPPGGRRGSITREDDARQLCGASPPRECVGEVGPLARLFRPARSRLLFSTPGSARLLRAARGCARRVSASAIPRLLLESPGFARLLRAASPARLLLRAAGSARLLRVSALEGVEVELPCVVAEESVEGAHERRVASQLLPVPAGRASGPRRE